jgi:hypothetical protein
VTDFSAYMSVNLRHVRDTVCEMKALYVEIRSVCGSDGDGEHLRLSSILKTCYFAVVK